jgi:hypothetical protein
VECESLGRRSRARPRRAAHANRIGTGQGEAGASDDLNASKGVFFTTRGYQSGAETQAKFDGIEIFTVREMTDEEWGGPGRQIDFFLHIVSLGYGKIQFPDARVVTIPSHPIPQMNLNIIAGAEGFESTTPAKHKGKDSTIEKILQGLGLTVLDHFNKIVVTFNDRTDCTVHLKCDLNVLFEPVLEMQTSALVFPVVQLPRMTCEIGIRVVQSRFKFDRGDKYLFALAIENCISGAVYAASRTKDAETTTLQPLPPPPAPPENPEKQALRNGPIMRVVTKAFFDFKELEGKTSVDFPQLDAIPFASTIDMAALRDHVP